MNALTRWNPFRTAGWDPFKELDEFEQRLGRMLRKPNGEGTEAIASADWAPVVDISEDEKEFLVKAELPGLKREEVTVTVDENVLTIAGERKVEKEEKTKKYHRVERAYGKFERSFALPDRADGEKVTAEFKEGVLVVHLPKSPKAAPKKTEVKIT
jgi:HSP20 family protein